eukprot:8663303-Pyramimonas_sp.AAC.1
MGETRSGDRKRRALALQRRRQVGRDTLLGSFGFRRRNARVQWRAIRQDCRTGCCGGMGTGGLAPEGVGITRSSASETSGSVNIGNVRGGSTIGGPP